ncbi:hypothetical protein BLNAU_25115 [Blattamonas nauphoetae]|uniref:4Fe-4S ferredoxin-type domain-containing protein n=1 Tax=Blattamonas nauphoetae TaxID=2049346 RepID=A0ABQ9WKH8_9EUKA|nr:hypothetical protein BLNAU_25115 [Blattamonas nauphoetae]
MEQPTGHEPSTAWIETDIDKRRLKRNNALRAPLSTVTCSSSSFSSNIRKGSITYAALEGKHLEGAGHSVSLHDGFLILKQSLTSGEKEVTPLLSNYHAALKEADIVGIGSYVSNLTIADGVAKLLTEEATPTSLFANMKYYFFSSFGSIDGQTFNYLATFLHNKNGAAKYLGSVGQRDPENHLPLPCHEEGLMKFQPQELKKVYNFGKTLIARLNSGYPSYMHEIVTTTRHPADTKPGAGLGTIKIDADKCIKCYKCVTVCPYNALAKPEEGAAVKIPVWDADLCYGCGRCFNYCPVRAIRFPKPIPSILGVLSGAVPRTALAIPLVLVGCLGLYPVMRRKLCVIDEFSGNSNSFVLSEEMSDSVSVELKSSPVHFVGYTQYVLVQHEAASRRLFARCIQSSTKSRPFPVTRLIAARSNSRNSHFGSCCLFCSCVVTRHHNLSLLIDNRLSCGHIAVMDDLLDIRPFRPSMKKRASQTVFNSLPQASSHPLNRRDLTMP